MNYIYTYSTKENCLNVKRSNYCCFLAVFAVSASASRPTGLVQEKLISPFTAFLVEDYERSFQIISWLNQRKGCLDGPV